MIATLEVKLTRAGVEYVAQIMRVRRTEVGYEDHGILTCRVDLEGASTGIAIGGYAYDQYDKALEKRVIKNGFGLDQMVEIMRVAGVRVWEHIPGKQVLLLSERPYGPALGIASLDAERVLIFKEHASKWYPEEEGE